MPMPDFYKWWRESGDKDNLFKKNAVFSIVGPTDFLVDVLSVIFFLATFYSDISCKKSNTRA